MECPKYINAFKIESKYELESFIIVLILATCATIMSFYLIIQHLLHYYQPDFQRNISRILLMVPVYAICSSISFGVYRAAIYVNVIRDCYEGFVIVSFFKLMCQYVAPDEPRQKDVLASKEPFRFPPPCCCFFSAPGYNHFLSWCKLGVNQYVVVRISTTIIAVLLENMNLYCSESMDYHFGHFWTTVLNGGSMGIAMFTLITFYIAVHYDISKYKPVLQFFSVKFVIFFGFWQGFFLEIFMSQISDLDSKAEWTLKLQSLLVCFEMFIASIIHLWAFDYTIFPVGDEIPRSLSTENLLYESTTTSDPLTEQESEPLGFLLAFWDAFYWLDIWHDVIFAGQFIIRRVSKTCYSCISRCSRRRGLERLDGDSNSSINIDL